MGVHPCLSNQSLDEESAPELLSTLRDATGELHQRIEAKLLPDGQCTRARYGAMLQAFHQVISPVETRLCDLLGDDFLPPPPMSRAERIRADLGTLGREILPGPDSDRLTVESQADAYGVAYVLQGSLLGGTVLLKQMRRDPSKEPIPAGYLELYGDGLAEAWRRFCQAANSFGREIGIDERQRTAKAAIDAFRAFERALDRVS